MIHKITYCCFVVLFVQVLVGVTGQVITISQCPDTIKYFVKGTEVTLKCDITSFTTATWVLDNNVLTTCTSTFCTTDSTSEYTFSKDNTGIEVVIKTNSNSGVQLWECTQSPDAANCTLLPTESTTATTSDSFSGSTGHISSTTPKDGSNSLNIIWIIVISVVCCGIVVIVAIFISRVLIYKRKKAGNVNSHTSHDNACNELKTTNDVSANYNRANT